jgi:hypothetical protein
MEKLKMMKKVLVLSLAMLAALPIGAFAQEGLFQRSMTDETYYGFGSYYDNCGLFGKHSAITTGTIDNQTFGQPVPLGSGVLLLVAAGAGYGILKRKEDEK